MFAITFDMKVNARRVTGTYELDFNRMTRKNLISEIVEGQFENIARVFEFDAAEGTASDITEDMARDCAAHAFNNGLPVGYRIRSWMEETCGVDVTRGLLEAA